MSYLRYHQFAYCTQILSTDYTFFGFILIKKGFKKS